MKFLPISINISGKKLLIIGGGKIAYQKLKSLKLFTRNITVLAPSVSAEIKKSGVSFIEKKYSARYLRGHFIAYACTDDRALNARIGREAREKGLLVNVADDPENCDFISPAIFKKGIMTVAVSSDGKNVKKSVELRNRISGWAGTKVAAGFSLHII